MRSESNRLLGTKINFVVICAILMSLLAVRIGVSNSDTATDPGVRTLTDESHPKLPAPVEEQTPGMFAEESGAETICLSPGHPSAEGDKYYEAVINRKVAWFLKYRLEAAGYNVVFAVQDVSPVELFFAGYTNESEELWSRLSVMTPEEKANRCNDLNADYLISVHHNYAYDINTNQTMVFYTQDEEYRPVHPAAKEWAEITARHLAQTMQTGGGNAIADMERVGFQLGILSNADMPGILTEASFYSNPQERARLNDDFYLAEESQAIYEAFIAQWK